MDLIVTEQFHATLYYTEDCMCVAEAPRVTSNTDTSSEYIDTPQPSEPKSTGKMIEEPRQGPEHHQLYQSGQHKPECQVDDEKDHDDSGSVVSTTETFEM